MPEGGASAAGHATSAAETPDTTEGFYARRLKRGLDALLAALLLLAVSPLLLGLALCVRSVLGRPVLFRQERAGRGGAPFVLLKFRSMRRPAWPGEPDAERLGRFGRALRASGLDELPQLLHVLRGYMSLVGPRPLPTEYDRLYTPRQRTRLRVRPGLLGLAQARGRNALPWDAKLEWDARYAEQITFRGDVAAALGSLSTLARGQGSRAPGHATSPPLCPASIPPCVERPRDPSREIRSG